MNLADEIITVGKDRATRIKAFLEELELQTALGKAEARASLILGSSLIVIADVRPRVYNIPMLSYIGFILAGVLGLFWIRSVLKRDDY